MHLVASMLRHLGRITGNPKLMVKEMRPTVCNQVAVTHVGFNIDLAKLALQEGIGMIKYNPNIFSGLTIYSKRSGNMKFNVFSNQIVIVGCRTDEDLRYGHRYITRTIRRLRPLIEAEPV